MFELLLGKWMNLFEKWACQTIVLLGVASLISRGGAQGCPCKHQNSLGGSCILVSDIRDNT